MTSAAIRRRRRRRGGCHGGARDHARGGARRLARARRWSGSLADYPRGPHDQPQSMCPAFGSLRVGLRMRRTATILCGLGLLRLRSDLHLALLWRAPHRRLRAVQLRDPGHAASCSRTSATRCSSCAKPDDYDAVVIINLCVPTASGVPLDRLPKADRRRAHHRHRRARASACRPMPRPRTCWPAPCCAMRGWRPKHGPVQRPRALAEEQPTVTLIGELFPADPVGIGALLGADGTGGRAAAAVARMARSLRRARLRRRPRRVHPFYVASIREFHAAGRPVVGSGPVGVDGTAAWLEAIGKAGRRRAGADRRRQGARRCRRSAARWRRIRSAHASPCRATKARSCWSRGC